jgi:hypothetical protein
VLRILIPISPQAFTLIDSDAIEGVLYYVLPFVRGESLRDKLNRDKQLGIDAALYDRLLAALRPAEAVGL